MDKTLRLRAAAKINLALDVLCRRADGYHQVDMIMQSVSLYDELTAEPWDELRLEAEGDVPADRDNLVLRAALALREATGCARGAKMHLRKRIPVAAGLGGGSADAAATLHALNRLWDLHLPLERLQKVGAALGADIPFCLTGGTQRATGIGVDLSPLPKPPPMTLLIAKPCEGMLTRDVYRGLRFDKGFPGPDMDGAIRALQDGDVCALCDCMGNALESVTLAARPQAAQCLQRLMELGAMAARMSGSGPAVFGVFEREADALAARGALGVGELCHPVEQGIEYIF